MRQFATMHETPTTETRNPHWLGYDLRAALRDAIDDFLVNCEPLPAMRNVLNAVRTELDVATARDHVFPKHTTRFRRISGFPDDVLPIRMSEAEKAVVLTLPGLPDGLTAALTTT